MTAYRKNVVTWLCFMAVGLSFILGMLYVTEWFVIPFFILVASSYYIFNKITCPNCGTPVTYQGKLANFRIKGGFIRKKCQQCGWDLRKNLPE